MFGHRANPPCSSGPTSSRERIACQWTPGQHGDARIGNIGIRRLRGFTGAGYVKGRPLDAPGRVVRHPESGVRQMVVPGPLAARPVAPALRRPDRFRRADPARVRVHWPWKLVDRRTTPGSARTPGSSTSSRSPSAATCAYRKGVPVHRQPSAPVAQPRVRQRTDHPRGRLLGGRQGRGAPGRDRPCRCGGRGRRGRGRRRRSRRRPCWPPRRSGPVDSATNVGELTVRAYRPYRHLDQ